MAGVDGVWDRIGSNEGQTFRTFTGLPFTYVVTGGDLRVNRDGREINRTLSRRNFEEAQARMPTSKPSDIKDCQGSAYTWAILMDPRVRGGDL